MIVLGVLVILLVIGAIASGGDSDDDSSSGDDTTPATEAMEEEETPAETAAPAETEAMEEPEEETPETEAPAEEETRETEAMEEETPEATEAPAEGGGEAGGAITVTESGFTSVDIGGTAYTSAGAVVVNDTDQLACGVTVQFSLLDDAGTPFETSTESIDFIPAGQSVPVAPLLLGFDTQPAADMSVEFISVDETTSGDTLADCDLFFSIVEGIELEVSGLAIVPDEFFSEITGQVTNPSDTLVETAFVDCVLRDDGGTVVGGESTALLDPVTPGGSVAFDVGVSALPETATSAECRVVG